MMENNETEKTNPDVLTRQVVVANEHGLHARPAGKLAQKAMAFEAEIAIVCKEQRVDAKSILDVLTLAAAAGDVLELHASGEDADQALDSLQALFKNKFEE